MIRINFKERTFNIDDIFCKYPIGHLKIIWPMIQEGVWVIPCKSIYIQYTHCERKQLNIFIFLIEGGYILSTKEKEKNVIFDEVNALIWNKFLLG